MARRVFIYDLDVMSPRQIWDAYVVNVDRRERMLKLGREFEARIYDQTSRVLEAAFTAKCEELVDDHEEGEECSGQ